jgi:hypothetical protein
LAPGLLERSDTKNVDFFLVIDFEATCEEKNPPGYPHEIIEFPAVLVTILPKVTNVGSQIFVIANFYSFYILVTFYQYSLVGQVFWQSF